MKKRPDGFLSKENISHDSEQFDYIKELHEYLWEFVRCEIPEASGSLRDFIDEALLKAANVKVIMKFKDAPIGARFKFILNDGSEDVYVKIHAHEDGLIVKWEGNVKGRQSHCCWIDMENGYDFDTEIELI